MAAQLPIADPAPKDGLLPESASTGAESRSFHAYVHIPFCSVRCGYCDFNTYTADELRGVKKLEFAQHLADEMNFSQLVLQNSGLPSREFSSVFFGGGTPTQLPAQQLVKLLQALGENFGFKSGAEITVEANPDNLDDAYAEELAGAGFTRVSIGMQSAVAKVLRVLDRTHTPENVARAVNAAKSAGLSTSLDLIYGAPGESLDDWRASLEQAIALQTDHISAYALIVEPGTKLDRQIRSGELSEPDDDLSAEKYELAEHLLSAAGFGWYEVSNWARSDSQRSEHNLAYWRGNDWWGYGPGAHSHIGGVRWWNAKHPATYAQSITNLQSPAVGRESLDAQTRLVERVLLESRISDGLSVEIIKGLNPNAAKPISEALADGLIEVSELFDGRIKLTLRGRLLADALVRNLIG